jgi:hypothetical protein
VEPLGFLGKSNHFALGRVDVLPGNIGYMEINGFSVDQAARDVVVGALKYLQTTDALIIDLRRNRGGDANLVNFLISHFTGPDACVTDGEDAVRQPLVHALHDGVGPRSATTRRPDFTS